MSALPQILSPNGVEKACCHDFIMTLPDGYETIIILDEATAHAEYRHLPQLRGIQRTCCRMKGLRISLDEFTADDAVVYKMSIVQDHAHLLLCV